jgi:putative intracellular protease/amidase
MFIIKKLTSLILLFAFFVIPNIAFSENKNILIVVTNHDQLGTTGEKTGYYLAEVTHPYFKFIQAGYNVVFASPKGGYAPMDPKSKDLSDTENNKFYENKVLMKQLDNTIALKDVNANEYEAIVFAGGHGTMWDFHNSDALNVLAANIYAKGGIVAAVCHGPAALLNIKLSNGEHLIKGKSVTGFTNKEEDIVELSSQMPFMLETELIKRGAIFSSAHTWKEKVVVDGRLITGQNPASASALGAQIINALK